MRHLFLLATAACYAPSYPYDDGALACSPAPDLICPSSYHCASDGLCYHDADAYALELTTSGTGTVASDGAALSCASCGSMTSYVPARIASYTLTATTVNGDASFFQGWGGDCAASGTLHTCTLPGDRPHRVSATFGSLANRNLIFVSSVPVAGNLGGFLPYDDECNTLANAAGINETAGRGYIAWLGVMDTVPQPWLRAARRPPGRRRPGRPERQPALPCLLLPGVPRRERRRRHRR
jgi:hypothetical protein